ncbi:MAG TPA: hypothetical protein VFI16_00025 [Anaeromyxobacteraceae bacterium]|nr:hypothetical protein [Anaeromyxobacteraceae bacterium]
MRLSRGRVLLRAALLWAGGGWALWWAWRTHGRAGALDGAGRALLDRLALVYALVGALAVLTGLVAALAARRRARRHTLRLGAPAPGEGAPASPDGGGPGEPVEPPATPGRGR